LVGVSGVVGRELLLSGTKKAGGSVKEAIKEKLTKKKGPTEKDPDRTFFPTISSAKIGLKEEKLKEKRYLSYRKRKVLRLP